MKQVKKNQIDLTKLIFLVSYCVITLVALIFVVTVCVRPFKITNIDDLKQVEYKEYKSQDADEYYVFVYSEDEVDHNWYKDLVVQYANKARTLSNYSPIYGYDLDAPTNSKIKNDMTLTEVPTLLLIKNGSVSSTYKTWAEIRNALTEAMNK